jgi:hypothetical protein
LDEHVAVYDVARQLPAIADLWDLCRSLAMLDAILSPDWEDRYYSMNAGWADGEEMASMRNGSGDEYSIVFSTAGVYVRGFDHESPMSPYGNDGEPWPGVIDEVPDLFKPFVEEPAFTDEDGVPVVTACLWRGATDDRWHHGTIDFPDRAVDPDGATGLFELLVRLFLVGARSWSRCCCPLMSGRCWSGGRVGRHRPRPWPCVRGLCWRVRGRRCRRSWRSPGTWG